jgi:hypothetical protein
LPDVYATILKRCAAFYRRRDKRKRPFQAHSRALPGDGAAAGQRELRLLVIVCRAAHHTGIEVERGSRARGAYADVAANILQGRLFHYTD